MGQWWCGWALHKKCVGPTKERGQAHPPNIELINLYVLIGAGKAFNVERLRSLKSLEVGKAGLAPGFFLRGRRLLSKRTFNYLTG
jgi:hypothetical protein